MNYSSPTHIYGRSSERFLIDRAVELSANKVSMRSVYNYFLSNSSNATPVLRVTVSSRPLACPIVKTIRLACKQTTQL